MTEEIEKALAAVDAAAARPELTVLAPEGTEVGRVLYFPGLLEPGLATAVQERLEIPWEQLRLPRFGCLEPRKTAWFCDRGCTYTYTGVTRRAAPWSPAPLALRPLLERVLDVHVRPGARLTSCLANLYEDGRHSVSPHRDNEKEFVRLAPIASLTFGATRPFTLRHHPAGERKPREHRLTYELGHGDLLVMAGAIQDHYTHGIAKTATPVGPRVNLTFRHHDLRTDEERKSAGV